jgi:3,4-dihydroxy 2-butanone 4-phosphate synthase
MSNLHQAIKALQKGELILLHDGGKRENEIDLVVNSLHVKPQTIQQLRKDAGGLICLAVDNETAGKLGLPYMTELMESSKNKTLGELTPEKTPYGDKPAFSVSINHRDTYTGVTDKDRALTISEFAKMMGEGRIQDFTKKFYSPGHVPLLIAKNLDERRGHTELSIELARRAGLTPAMVLCEMMGDDCNALSKEKALAYARKHGLVFVDGRGLYER